VWRDLMLALHARIPGRAPPPPPGIEARAIAFADHIEQPRREYFVRGTGQALLAAAPGEARRPRIVNPIAGTVYAIDPDIPPARQRFAVGVSGSVASHRLMLDDRDLGPAAANPLVLAAPGLHRLRLIDIAGRVVDQVRFTIR
jgi:penicillin-binding protein 1C